MIFVNYLEICLTTLRSLWYLRADRLCWKIFVNYLENCLTSFAKFVVSTNSELTYGIILVLVLSF